MTGGNIEQFVKARWLAMGVSQSDLAEILDAAFQQNGKDDRGPGEVDAGRLRQVADALNTPITGAATGSLQSLLELRLLMAFVELRDDRTKRMLVHLAEQIVKRQGNRQGDET